jgi:hypothetical protein
MHRGPKQSKEIERRLSGRELRRPTIKSAGANQQVEDATSNAARVFIVCIIQV